MTKPSAGHGIGTAPNVESEESLLLQDGTIKRVAIVTVDLHPCACYLARRLRSAGVEITIYSQRHQARRLGRARYLRRLLKRRGWLVFADNLLLESIRRVRRLTGASTREVVPQSALPPSLRLDPEIISEP